MIAEEAIIRYERLVKKTIKDRDELISINNVLEVAGVSQVDTDIINNMNTILTDLGLIIPALEKSIKDGVLRIYSGDHLKIIVERYKRTI